MLISMVKSFNPVVLALAILLVAFVGAGPNPRTYFEKAILLIKEHSIHREHVDWATFEENCAATIDTATSIEGTYTSIKAALRATDWHSFFVTPERARQEFKMSSDAPEIRSEVMMECLGYLEIPSFSGNEKAAEKFISNIQKAIKQLDAQELKGWIIDLRTNEGGNMWPMLAGLSPLLDTDTLGYFRKADGRLKPWVHATDGVYLGSEPIQAIKKPLVLNNEDKPISVITGRKTKSSGEAVAIAFVGQENALLYGQKTYGLSTANSGFELEDGAMLFITTSVFTDRDKKVYGSSIQPDVVSDDPLAEIFKFHNF